MRYTKLEKFFVKEPTSSVFSGTHTHIWFQVLEGPDEGMRLRIPLYHEEYTDSIAETLSTIDEGAIVKAQLKREDDTDVWRPETLEVHETDALK